MMSSQKLLLIVAVVLITADQAIPNNVWTPECPIGFQHVRTLEKSDSYCIRLKGLEAFSDKFVDCTDNKFTSTLYKTLNMKKLNVRLWAEYKSLYPGGPLIDWSYSDSTGDILTTTFDINYDTNLGIDEELCTVIEPGGNLTAVRCNEEYQRFCVVKPYDEFDESNEGCGELKGYFRAWSPRATCLSRMTGVNGGSVRANWWQALELCQKHRGTILQRGWRYANHPLLTTSTSNNTMEPLGIKILGDKLLWLNDEDGNKLVPESERSFDDEDFGRNASFVALYEDSWHAVNSSVLFYSVVCERSIHLRNITLKVTNSEENGLTLTVNDSSVDEKKLWCFTDSSIFYPSKVNIDLDDKLSTNNTLVFELKTIFLDGYYWCINADSKDFRVSESNKELLINNKDKIKNLYAIKVRAKKKYDFRNLEKLREVWNNKLSTYIYLRTEYRKQYGEEGLASKNETKVLKKFKSNLKMDRTSDVLSVLNFKRIYIDGKTALLHGQLVAGMEPVPPGFWEDLEVVFMKPTYFCRPSWGVPLIELGSSVTVNCSKYTCLGDFNEGVQLVETAVDECVVTTQQPIIVEASIAYPIEETTQAQQVKNAIRTQATNDDHKQQDNTEDSSVSSNSTESIEDISTTISTDIDSTMVVTVNSTFKPTSTTTIRPSTHRPKPTTLRPEVITVDVPVCIKDEVHKVM